VTNKISQGYSLSIYREFERNPTAWFGEAIKLSKAILV